MAHVMLLEDDGVLAEQLKEVLELDEHSVAEFSNVDDALAYFDVSKVDLIVSDFFFKKDGLHEKGGIFLISKIKQIIGSSVPIIAISGSFSAEDSTVLNKSPIAGSTLTVGATAVLAKPFDPQELLALVDELTNRI